MPERAWQLGADHVINDANNFFPIGREIINVFAVLFEVVPSAVAGVCKIDAAFGVEPEVVRAVEFLAIVFISYCSNFAAGVYRA